MPKRRSPSDFQAEIEAHIELEAARLREEGMSEEAARAGSRLDEIAIRAAIGASRFQVWRAVAIEYAVVSVVGIAAGLLVAWVALGFARSALPIELPRAGVLSLTPSAIAGGGGLSLIVGAIGALASAAALRRLDVALALRSGGRSGVRGWGTHPVRQLLVAVQLALAVTAVAGAGLLVRTLERLHRIDLGLEPRGLLFGDVTVSVPADSAFLANGPRTIDQLLEAVERVPGVASAATTFSPPFVREGGAYSRMKAEGQPEAELAGMPLANRETVTPGYFATMGMTLLRGRFLLPSDREDAAPVVVINDALARHHWPGKNPIGQRLGYADGPNPSWRTVVGVVANARYHDLKVASPAVYVPYRQMSEPPFYLLVRTAPGAATAAVTAGLRRVIHQLGIGLTLVSATPMDVMLAKPLESATIAAALTLGFAAVALLLAGLGIYGVLSSFVVQRTREFGVRMALGADARSIGGLVVRQAARLILAGMAAGVLASVVIGRSLSAFLYQVSPSDPVTLAVVAVVLGAMAAAVLLGPALRAARTDPSVSLRSE